MGAQDNDASNGEQRAQPTGLPRPGRGRYSDHLVALSMGPGGKALAQIIKPPPIDKPKKTYSTVLRRAVDQLVLSLDFWNLVPDFTTTPIALRQVDPNAVANYLSVGFPGQNLAEEVFFRAGSPTVAQSGDHSTAGIPLHPARRPSTSGWPAPADSSSSSRARRPAVEQRPADVQPRHVARLDVLRPERRTERPTGHPAVETALALGKPVKPSPTPTAVECRSGS